MNTESPTAALLPLPCLEDLEAGSKVALVLGAADLEALAEFSAVTKADDKASRARAEVEKRIVGVLET